MSLLIASDTSMVTIMKCLTISNDLYRNTLRNLMKCSHKISKVADENGFSKIPEAEVTIYFFVKHSELMNYNYFKADVSAHICLYVQDGDPNDQLEKTNYINFAKSDNHSKSMDEVLLCLPSKVKTIKYLQIVGANIDEDMLEVFKKHGNIIKTINHMVLHRVRWLEWNSDQILQFMKLFDNLETFQVGAYFKELATGVITNEMLSLVKTSVEIHNMLDNQRTPFPHITSSIFDFWIEKNTIKNIDFKGIITEIPISSVRRMIEHLRNNPKHFKPIHFGTLKYSSDFHQQLVLFQRQRGFKFSVTNSNGSCNLVIISEKSRQEFTFEARLDDNAVL